MPILERDPWRHQYFEHVACPDDVLIPTDDADCWALYPAHRWIYNKLLVAESQGLPCGPHRTSPTHFPVFSKPITNLKGMGTGSLAISTVEELEQQRQPGHMWMKLLVGDHISTDCVVLDGKVHWTRHASGTAGPGGTFKFWKIEATGKPQLEEMIADWVLRHMQAYKGIINFETIDGHIIEAHLRFADQWCDLYGAGWVEALVKLYAHGVWNFHDGARRVGYSIPLFAQHGGEFLHPCVAAQARIRLMPHVKSLQITFHENKDAAAHPMPPGGFRLAVINATNLEAGLAAREALALAFPKVKMLC